MRIAKPPSTPPTMAPILCLLDVVDDVKELVVIVDTVAVLLAEAAAVVKLTPYASHAILNFGNAAASNMPSGHPLLQRLVRQQPMNE